MPRHVVSNLKPPPPPPPPPAELEETPSSSQLKKPPPPPSKTVQRDVDQGDVVTKKMPPTVKKRRGDPLPLSSKKQKAMAVDFDMPPLPDDPDEEGERKVSVKTDSREKST